MSKIFLHLGSNEGDRLKILSQALEEIGLKIGLIKTKSSVYETEAWGKKDQPDFLNMAVEVESDLSPSAVLKEIESIQLALGGIKQEKWGPRTIDIDLLLYDDLIVEEDALNIPHQHMHTRNFVLIPLLEIAEDVMHPVFQKTVYELYDECKDECEVFLLESEID